MSEQNNVLQLKRVAAKLTGKSVDKISGYTIADVLDYIQANYTAGSGGGGATISSVVLNVDSEKGIDNGLITMSDGSTIPIELKTIESLTLKAAEGSATKLTKITVTPTLTSGNHYRYKLASQVMPAAGQDLTEWTEWDGVAEIEAQNGTVVMVAECDSNNKAVKCGECNAVAPLF